MFMHDTGALPAIALQLAGALDAYAHDLAELVAAGGEPQRYERVSRRMDEMRLYSIVLPAVSAAWVEVLIGHFELTHCLWRLQAGEADAGELRALHARHVATVQVLQARCAEIGTVRLA